MFLTPDQIRELTGYRQPAAQVRWLQKNGVQHYVRADGHPIVPVTAFQAPEPAIVLPNFEAVRARH